MSKLRQSSGTYLRNYKLYHIIYVGQGEYFNNLFKIENSAAWKAALLFKPGY